MEEIYADTTVGINFNNGVVKMVLAIKYFNEGMSII